MEEPFGSSGERVPELLDSSRASSSSTGTTEEPGLLGGQRKIVRVRDEELGRQLDMKFNAVSC